MVNETSRSQEIDLMDLIVGFFVFLKKRMKIVLTFLVLGGILSIVVPLMKKNSYRISLMAHSTTVPNDVVMEFINHLQDYIDRNEYDRLKDDLRIPIGLASQIRSIHAEAVANTTELARFIITVESISNVPLPLDSIRNAMILFVSNQEFVKERTSVYRKQQNQLIKMMDEKIIEYDSLRNIAIQYNNLMKNDRVFILNESKSFYKELVELYEKKLIAERELELAKEMEVIESQEMLKHADFVFNIKTMLIYVVAGFALGCAAGFALEIRDKMKSSAGS